MRQHWIVLQVMFTFLLIGATNQVNAHIDYCYIPDSTYDVGDGISRYLERDDYSVLFTGEYSEGYHGYIGENYRRLRMKFLSVIKDPEDPSLYRVYGKSNVGGNVCDYIGEMRIERILASEDWYTTDDDTLHFDMAIEYGQVLLRYEFHEDPNQQHAGTFSGIVVGGWYRALDSTIRYDDIWIDADTFDNNQFMGTWTEYGSTKDKRCNWGHHRVCDPQNRLDVGVGEFTPNENYLEMGWRSYWDAYLYQSNARKILDALRIESEEWWK